VTRFSDLLDDIDLAIAGTAVVQVPLGRIDADPDNPRKAFDEAALAGLAQSIRERGLLQPVTLVSLGEGRYRIIFGDRRVRAARLAGLARVPAIIRAGAADAVVDQIVENDQREALSALEMADAVGRLLALGLSQAAIGARLGRTPTDISMYAAVRDFPAPLREGFLERSSIRAAYALYVAWKTTPAEVMAFVAAHPDGVSVQRAGAFARGLKARSASTGRGGAAPDVTRDNVTASRRPAVALPPEPARTTHIPLGRRCTSTASIQAQWEGQMVRVVLPALVEIESEDGERRTVARDDLRFGAGEGAGDGS
jgi:ParB family transcriptional regulator, chromosome partitioning protein